MDGKSGASANLSAPRSNTKQRAGSRKLWSKSVSVRTNSWIRPHEFDVLALWDKVFVPKRTIVSTGCRKG